MTTKRTGSRKLLISLDPLAERERHLGSELFRVNFVCRGGGVKRYTGKRVKLINSKGFLRPHIPIGSLKYKTNQMTAQSANSLCKLSV